MAYQDSPFVIVETERLLLRSWVKSDEELFCEMNQDREVMKYFPDVIAPEKSVSFIHKQNQQILDEGYGLFALEIKATGSFAGFVGYAVPSFQASFTPCVEIGWRIRKEMWCHGYATEGATALIATSVEKPDLPLVSFTARVNVPSRRVMEKIGLLYSESEDFLHPLLPPESELASHVLYRLPG